MNGNGHDDTYGIEYQNEDGDVNEYTNGEEHEHKYGTEYGNGTETGTEPKTETEMNFARHKSRLYRKTPCGLSSFFF